MAQSVLAYITGGMIFIAALLIFSKPLKGILKIIVHSAIGCGAIFLFNLFKDTTGLFIGLNAATAATVGILGLPGFIMLLILQFIFR